MLRQSKEELRNCCALVTGLAAMGLACTFGSPALASIDEIIEGSGCPSVASPDESDQDNCGIDPFCYLPMGDTVYVNPGEEIVVPLLIDGLCANSDSLEVRLFVNGVREDDRDFTDQDGPICVGLSLEQIRNQPEGTCWPVRAVVVDEDSDGSPGGGGPTSTCEFEIKVMCITPPDCYINGERIPAGSREVAVMTYDVETGDTLPDLEICAYSNCENAARVEMFARPPFMEPAGHRKGAPGEMVCIETKPNDIVEGGFAEGTYWAKFRCVDLVNGEESILKVGYRYTDPEPEPEPEPEALLCEEDESQSPNDTYAGATEIDAGECADDMGVMVSGVLDTPMVINGDVDFYRLTGLNPDQSYTATIVAGMNNQNGFTNTLLGWFADEGVIVASDDNSGSRAEYSKVEFVSDGAGAVTLAVTGYGDDDFNGLMTPGMPYDEYGHGGYMLLVSAIDTADTEEMPLERQADLNGDGVVDTGDLGVLIGLFGTTSN